MILVTHDSNSIVSLYVTLTKTRGLVRGGGGGEECGVMGYQYTWFLFPELPLCQTTKNLYLSSYAKCSISEILEIKWCILTGKRYLIYCTCIKLLASPDKQKCAAFFLTAMVRKVSTLKLMVIPFSFLGTHVHILSKYQGRSKIGFDFSKNASMVLNYTNERRALY